MDKLRAPNWPNLYNSASYNRQTGNHTYLSCRSLILEEHENFNIELHRSRGIAIAILGRRCLMSRLHLRSSMRLIGLVDQLSVHIWQDGDHRAGSQRRQSWTDQKIWLPGVSVSVVHRCRSLLLSFSTYYLSILGLEGAINCILVWTSHQRTTSEKRTKALLPKCPLFRGFTVHKSWDEEYAKLKHNCFYQTQSQDNQLLHSGNLIPLICHPSCNSVPPL